MQRNLCRQVLAAGGDLIPLLAPPALTDGMGLMNPSVLVRGDEVLCNIRQTNYTLWHCENDQLFNNGWGPLVYLNPEKDVHLRTKNILCRLGDDYQVAEAHLVDTSLWDIPAVWEFVGLEDARLLELNGKLYLCGVRRDLTPVGQGNGPIRIYDGLPKTQGGDGRMELSELEVTRNTVREVARFRIETPVDKNSYLEKNWMPILDQPWQWVKWCNPTEVVRVSLAKSYPKQYRVEDGKPVLRPTVDSERVLLREQQLQGIPDLRGGSHVLRIGAHRIALTHTVIHQRNELGLKDAQYPHRIVVWDLDWNVVKVSEGFLFMDGEIEFCCGAALHKGNLLVTFGFQDNAAFILKTPLPFLEELVGVKL
jgi:hypothetical protein